ncbi:hypothetical protein DYB26_014781, partial [Aphanomyces astaci]
MSLTLYCAIVNDGSTIKVEVHASASVAQLKKLIAKKMQYPFPAYELTLYLAKLADGDWLPGDAAALVRLSNGHLDEDISKYLTPSNQMFPAMGLNYHFGMEVPPRNVVHVLVRVPSARWDEVRPHKKHKVSSTDNDDEEKDEAVEGVQGATSIPPDVIASIEGRLGLINSQDVGGGV